LFLVHGAEEVLPIEIEHNSPRVAEYDEEVAQKALEDDVDALDEARDVVLSRVSSYQQNLKNYHSRRLRPRSFEVGDLVLRLTQDSHEKLESPWIGPYIVTEVIPGGAYRLKDKKKEKITKLQYIRLRHLIKIYTPWLHNNLTKDKHII
jgi:hypothetical protein